MTLGMHTLLLLYNIKLMASLSQLATQTLLEDTVTMQHISDCRAEHTYIAVAAIKILCPKLMHYTFQTNVL